MKLAAIMLIVFIIPATLGGQEVRIEGAHSHHLPATTSPDGNWVVKPLYHDGRFVSYIWTEQVKPPVPPEPPQPPAPPKPPPAPEGPKLRKGFGPWPPPGPTPDPMPIAVNRGGFVPQPPYDPSLFSSKPAPVPLVEPTPQCQVVYYTLIPTPVPSPYTRFGAGCYSAPRGCGFHPFRAIGRALFGGHR